jgi:hypothetical protein
MDAERSRASERQEAQLSLVWSVTLPEVFSAVPRVQLLNVYAAAHKLMSFEGVRHLAHIPFAHNVVGVDEDKESPARRLYASVPLAARVSASLTGDHAEVKPITSGHGAGRDVPLSRAVYKDHLKLSPLLSGERIQHFTDVSVVAARNHNADRRNPGTAPLMLLGAIGVIRQRPVSALIDGQGRSRWWLG